MNPLIDAARMALETLEQLERRLDESRARELTPGETVAVARVEMRWATTTRRLVERALAGV